MSHMTMGYSHEVTVISMAYNPYMVCKVGDYDGTDF